MTRPELWSVIDMIARTHPPGALRLTPAELVEWLGIVAADPKAHRETRRVAKKAAKYVHMLIGGVYEMPNYSPPPEPEPVASVPDPSRKLARQPSLPGFGDENCTEDAA